MFNTWYQQELNRVESFGGSTVGRYSPGVCSVVADRFSVTSGFDIFARAGGFTGSCFCACQLTGKTSCQLTGKTSCRTVRGAVK